MLLNLVRFVDPTFFHVSDCSGQDVHAHGLVAGLGPFHALLCLQIFGVRAAQLGDQLRCVQTRIVADGGGDGQQGFGVRLHGQGSFSGGGLCSTLHVQGHSHLRASTAAHHSGIFHGGFEHAQSIVKGPLGLIQHVAGRSAQHHGAGLAQRHSGEAHHGLLSHGDLFHQVAGSQSHLNLLVCAKVGGDLSTSDQRQALDAIKVGVLDGHDPGVREELLGVVVDELSIDEAGGTGVQYGLALVFHLGLLRCFEVSHLLQALGPDSCAIELELVGVHGGVGDQYLGVFHPFGLSDPRLLVQQEPVIEEGVLEATAWNLDDLYGIQPPFAFEPQDGLHGQLREVDLFLGEDLGGQGGARQLEEILAEPLLIFRMIHGQVCQGFQGHLAGGSIPRHHGHGMQLLFQKQGFRVFEKLSGEHDDGRGSVSHLVVLCFGDVHEQLGGWIVHVHGLEDGGPVVGDLHVSSAAHRLQDLVHSFGS
eukprot:scaffold416_cov329-Pavlova_lutheri.AAC.6